MNKLRHFFIFLVFIPFLYVTPAQSQQFAVKGNAGTLGTGIELVAGVSESVSIRAGGNFFDLTRSWESYSTSDFELSTDMRLRNITALADWYPFSRSKFRITGGVVWNMNDFSGTLTPLKTFTVGGDTYTPEDLGTVDVLFDFPALAPYAGFGYGSPFIGSSFGMNVDLGFFYQQSPGVTFHAPGLLKPTESQAAVMQNNLEWADLYPVLTLSLYYKL